MSPDGADPDPSFSEAQDSFWDGELFNSGESVWPSDDLPVPPAGFPTAHPILLALQQTRRVQFAARSTDWYSRIDNISALHQAERAMAVALLVIGGAHRFIKVPGISESLSITEPIIVPNPDGVSYRSLSLQVTHRGHLVANRAEMHKRGQQEGFFSMEEGIALMNRAHWTAPPDTGLVFPLGPVGALAVSVVSAIFWDASSLSHLWFTLTRTAGTWIALAAVAGVACVRYVRFSRPSPYFEFPEGGRLSSALHEATMQRLGTLLGTWPVPLTANDQARLAVANGRNADTPSKYLRGLHGLNSIRAAAECGVADRDILLPHALDIWRQAERAMAYALVSAAEPRPTDDGRNLRLLIPVTWPRPGGGDVAARPLAGTLGRDGVLRVSLSLAGMFGVPLSALNPSVAEAWRSRGISWLVWPLRLPGAITLALVTAGGCALLRGDDARAGTLVAAGLVVAFLVAAARMRAPRAMPDLVETELDPAQHVALLEELLAIARRDGTHGVS